MPTIRERGSGCKIVIREQIDRLELAFTEEAKAGC